MKCKICGHRTTTLNAMRIHYLKKHPAAMKRKKKSVSRMAHAYAPREYHKAMKDIERFCPHCGAKL